MLIDRNELKLFH